MKIQTVSIIGLGALGVLFGYHLSKKMPNGTLKIIADEDRIKKYKREGVYCNGELCDFDYATPDQLSHPADLILIAVKYNSLPEAIQAVKHLVGVDTIILSVLNGITSEARIGKVLGMEKVVYCVAQGMDAVKVGNQMSYHHMGMLSVGDSAPGYVSSRVKALVDFFGNIELPYEVNTSMIKQQWGKFMLNVGVNQTAAVYKTNYGGIQVEGEARETMIAAMREVIHLSKYERLDLSEDDLSYWLGVLDGLNSEGKPSMVQDMDAGRQSEVELFSGTVLELYRKHGLSVPPINNELYQKIKLMEYQFV
ncbi:ketopantoate reductase family protein [Cytobacillus purgationiresistens]|uniref:2-dehydropantoate 2-reductase n=1 Tax=Cytobacillus purgationiresistens TaxID=863449 RepID=A0ABU0AQC7_9BACI|nr:ketopantoate reductase family protein [Cytobacillus purgationiresistens]MDQ0273452.1 2-dehydropantoate 2-reductase [Cytobacillus purgationiresistens]